MSFYTQHIYPGLVSAQLIPFAEGIVLEVGVGSGSNFAHYDAARVTKLYVLEPNPIMLRLADQQRRRTALNIEFLNYDGYSVGDGWLNHCRRYTMRSVRVSKSMMRLCLARQNDTLIFG